MGKLSSVEDFGKNTVTLQCRIVPPIFALCPLCIRVIYACYRQDCRVRSEDIVAAVIHHDDRYGCRPWRLIWDINVVTRT